MELRELGEPMQETELLVFRRKGPVKSWFFHKKEVPGIGCSREVPRETGV